MSWVSIEFGIDAGFFSFVVWSRAAFHSLRSFAADNVAWSWICESGQLKLLDVGQYQTTKLEESGGKDN